MTNAILKQLQDHADAGANELKEKTDVSNVIEALLVALSEGVSGINAKSLLVVAYTFYLQEIDVWEIDKIGPRPCLRHSFENRAYALAKEINESSQGYPG